MDKSIEQILTSFSHVAREIQIYFLSGAFIIGELILLQNQFDIPQLRLLKSLSNSNVNLMWLFGSMYIIGHFIHSFMYLVFEKSSLENSLKGFLSFKDPVSNNIIEKEIIIFKNNSEIHKQFVERYNILNLMLWNLSGASFLLFFTNLTIFFICSFKVAFLLVSIFNLFLFAVLYILSLKLENEMHNRVNIAYNLIQK